MNYDDFFKNSLKLNTNNLHIYQGHHSSSDDSYSLFSNIILPIKFFYEKPLLSVNLIGLLNNFKDLISCYKNKKYQFINNFISI